MKDIIILIVIVLLFIAVFAVLRLKSNTKRLLRLFKTGSNMTIGFKGCGKDLCFQKIIAKTKTKVYANIDYGFGTEVRPIKDINVGDNTFLNFLNDDVQPFDTNLRQNIPFFISDGGIFLPSQEDNVLTKKYKGLPIACAISRHIWNNQIHVNVQRIGRLWIKLREQQDWFLKAIGVVNLTKIHLGIFAKYRYYQKYESAEAGILPLRISANSILTKQEVSERKKEFDSMNGVIYEFWIWVSNKELKYDSRYFSRYVNHRPEDDDVLS